MPLLRLLIRLTSATWKAITMRCVSNHPGRNSLFCDAGLYLEGETIKVASTNRQQAPEQSHVSCKYGLHNQRLAVHGGLWLVVIYHSHPLCHPASVDGSFTCVFHQKWNTLFFA
jgi:proteasome lid subunit RPN8/RPN11